MESSTIGSSKRTDYLYLLRTRKYDGMVIDMNLHPFCTIVRILQTQNAT